MKGVEPSRLEAIPWAPLLFQERAVQHLVGRSHAGLFLKPGMRKTSITLAAFKILKKLKMVNKLFVIAPLRVIYTSWPQEVAKWKDFSHFSVGILHGSKKEKVLHEDHDIYLINYEGLAWLLDKLQSFKKMPFDMLVVDESTKLKNTSSARFKLFKPWLNFFKRRVILTGSPMANRLLDVFGQAIIMDSGATFGQYISHFRNEYFLPCDEYNGWVPKQGTEELIHARLAPRVYYAHSEDWLKLPPLIEKDIEVELPPKAMTAYLQMENALRLDFEKGKVVAANTGVATMKCIAEGTEVLTTVGWKLIENIEPMDKVWDGIEWVSIDKLQYNGYKDVVSCWGISLTADHKIMTAQGWVTAEEILDVKPYKRYDRYAFWIPSSSEVAGYKENYWNIGNGCVASSLRLWERAKHAWCKFAAQGAQQYKVLRLQAWSYFSGQPWRPWDVGHATVGGLECCETALRKSKQQKLEGLWWKRGKVFEVLGYLRTVLEGHGSDTQTWAYLRSEKCEWPILQDQLQMVYALGASQQRQGQCVYSNLSRSINNQPSRSALWLKVHNSISKGAAWLDRREISKPCKVYDVINAGPRARFTVRGPAKVPVLVHNCRQIANGGVYLDNSEKAWENIHDAKVGAVVDLVEELSGAPALITYEFLHDLERLKKALGSDTPHIGKGGIKPQHMTKLIESWNHGEVPYIIVNEQSMSHGVDGLQEAGRAIIWHSLTYNFENYDQLICRLHRSGQRERVLVAHIIAKGTIDRALMSTIRRKDKQQGNLFQALKEYWS